jgi:cell division protein FtsQ
MKIAAPYRNQRLQRPKKQRRQQQLLEVSLRADKERARRIKRTLAIIFKCVVFGALCVGVWVGTKEAMRRLVWENRTLFISDVRVTTDGTLTREQVLATGGIVEGRNILLLDLGKVRGALDALPQVERVEVLRTLPNRIDVEITERHPIAWMAARGETAPAISERSFLIDARGHVMKTRKLPPDYYSLPVISGYETENLVAGKVVTAFEVRAALDLIHLNGDSTRWQVRNVDVSKGYCLVVTDRSHATITFGLDNIDRQLTRLYSLLDVIEPTHQEIQTVNLFVEHNIPVTFVPPPGEEPPASPVAASPDPKEKSGHDKPAAAAAASPSPGKKAASAAHGKDKDKGKGKDSPGETLKPFSREALKKPFHP